MNQFLVPLLFACCLSLPIELTASGIAHAQPEPGHSGHAAEPVDSHAPAPVMADSDSQETAISGEGQGSGETHAKSDAAWDAVPPMEKAVFYHEQGDYSLAERTYIQVLESKASRNTKKLALIELAEVYYDKGVVAKAVDTLESCLRNYPEISEKPEILFRLGEFYRELGLKAESVAMFYRVLNSIVVTGEKNLDRYLSLARLAQFEIARSHYNEEAYERAYMLFDRIDLLEMNPVDRETVSYYKTLSALKAGHYEDGLKLLNSFEGAFSESAYLPEILFLKAECLYRMNRVEASSAALHRLLETVGTPDKDVSAEWTFWRQQAGNRLANRFYGDENFLVALRIYQGMVSLDDDASWQLPVIYQIGLCFEKLAMLDRARESYQYISDEIQALDPESLTRSINNLGDNASWRLQILSWRDDITEQIGQSIIKKKSPLNPQKSDT